MRGRGGRACLGGGRAWPAGEGGHAWPEGCVWLGGVCVTGGLRGWGVCMPGGACVAGGCV